MGLFSKFSAAIVIAAAFLCSSYAYASGYMLNEYSVTSMGRAFAGSGVVGDDFSAVASNPAGMQLFEGTAGGQAGATVVTLNGKFNGSGRTVAGTTYPSTSYGSARVEIQAVVPNFFAIYSITDRIKAGFGVYIPFGLGTEYPDSAITRLSAIKTDLQILELAPSLSFNIWKGLSLGVTANIQRASATLTQKFPRAVDAGGNTMYGELETKVSGDDWNAGATIGLMYDFGETCLGDASRIGLAYRSQVRHKIKGYHDINGAILNNPVILNGDASALLYLPNVVTLSAYHKFKSPIGLSATLRYIQWSIFDRLDIKSNLSSSSVNEDWRDTVSAHIGVDWFIHDVITLRLGGAFDMTPIRKAERRTARIPDSDRFLLSIGLSATPIKNWTIDVGYTHMFLQKSSISTQDYGRINGTYKYDMLSYLIGVQVQYKF